MPLPGRLSGSALVSDRAGGAPHQPAILASSAAAALKARAQGEREPGPGSRGCSVAAAPHRPEVVLPGFGAELAYLGPIGPSSPVSHVKGQTKATGLCDHEPSTGSCRTLRREAPGGLRARDRF